MPKKPKVLPAVGTVFAFRLPNKLYTTFRVLKAKRMDGEKYVLAVCSPFISKTLPTAITDEMKQFLHPSRWKKPSMYWINDPAEEGMIPLGMVAPSAEEKQFKTDSYGGWLNFQYDAQTNYRWNHDRKKLLADVKAEEQAMDEKRKRVQAEHDAAMKSMTLEKLAKFQFFPDWDDYPSTKIIKASRQVLKAHVAQLLDLGKPGTKTKKTAIIQACVEAFNALNKKHKDFIDTDIREDIVEEISRLSRACGLGEMDDQIDEWRDW
jgi:hypothetical protein